jgi:hypothetical protein
MDRRSWLRPTQRRRVWANAQMHSIPSGCLTTEFCLHNGCESALEKQLALPLTTSMLEQIDHYAVFMAEQSRTDAKSE